MGAWHKLFARKTPMKRNGTAADVAAAALFFATGPHFLTGSCWLWMVGWGCKGWLAESLSIFFSDNSDAIASNLRPGSIECPLNLANGERTDWPFGIYVREST